MCNMPEQLVKMPQSESPVARTGAGDISERELSRERHKLQTTPPARTQPANPKKQLFSTPVNKFTAKCSGPSSNLSKIRSCLDKYTAKTTTPVRPIKIAPKAISMEDLTPTKRVRRERREELMVVRSPGLHDETEQVAAAKIFRFMLLTAWRRRRDELKCVRKTLEFQVSCSERLRIQVCALKSLLDSDNAKVRLAMKELERLKQLLRDKEMEKNVLEREKHALENDVCAAEDRASEMSIGWRNCRNEMEGVRAAAAVSEHALQAQRAATHEARAQRDRANARSLMLEEELGRHEALLLSAEVEVAALRREADHKQGLLDETSEQLREELLARERCSAESAALGARVSAAAHETAALQGEVGALREQLARLAAELADTRRKLAWWPRPLTRMLGAARSWLRLPGSVPEAVLWSLVPARHGC